MADIYPEPEDEERAVELEPDAAPKPVGVYDRPERGDGTRVSLSLILVMLLIVVLAIYGLTLIF